MSIVTHSANPRPRFTEYLVRKKVFAESPLTIVDAGARGGAEKQWRVYGDQCRIIGFEADEEECIRMNKTAPKNERYYPAALWHSRAKVRFYIHPHAPTSSFYKSDATFLKRFPGADPLLPRSTTQLSTTDFATFAKENTIRDIDFLKMDVEGAELDVLQGLGKKFENAIIGISAEAVFCSWRHHMPTFADLDIFLRARRFALFDLPILRWEKRSTSPYLFTDGVFGPTDRGQVAWTQALYFKDAVKEMGSSTQKKHWDAMKLLKLASLMELHNLEDCAIELIQEASAKGLLGAYDTKKMIDLLTPPIDGRNASYAQYVEHIRRMGPPRYIDGRRVTQAEYANYLKKKT